MPFKIRLAISVGVQHFSLKEFKVLISEMDCHNMS